MRFAFLDTLRGLAALAVCFYHFLSQVPGFVDNASVSNFFYWGHKGVQVFFIISGIVIPFSMLKLNYKINYFFRYLGRRLLRLEPPYFIAILLGLGLVFLRQIIIAETGELTNAYSFGNVLAHLGYLVPFFEKNNWLNPVFWTLAIEFQYYIFLCLFFPLVTSNKAIHLVLFVFILLIISFYSSSSYFFPKWASFFGLGIAYSLYALKRINYLQFAVAFMLLLVMVITKQGLIDAVIGSITIAVIHFFKNIEFEIGNFFGNISYSLYLVHTIVGTTLINLSLRFFYEFTKQHYEFIFVFALAASVLFAYLFWLFIESPSQKLSKKFKVS